MRKYYDEIFSKTQIAIKAAKEIGGIDDPDKVGTSVGRLVEEICAA